MAITTPSDIQISTAGQMLVPAMASQPLQRALEDLNYLWKWHRPALIDCCPNADHVGSRHTFVYPILPSGEGLRYTFEHRLITSANTTVDIDVDYCTAYTGGSTTWHNLYSVTTGTTTATALWTQVDVNNAIPYNAEAIRVQYDPASGTIAPQHVLAYPAPDVPSAGITTLGFVPFDDGLLAGSTGAPVHTEFLNRCKRSALTVLRDRRQQVLSFLQAETGAPWTDCTGTPSVGIYHDLPQVRLVFPYQTPTVAITVSVLADVDAGTNTGLIQVRQLGIPGADAAVFDADGAINTASLTLTLQGNGLYRWADVAVSAMTTTGNHTRLRAVSAYWRPGD